MFCDCFEACDKRSIPAVTDACYTMAEGHTRGNFALPGSINVTYACNKGYKLQHPQKFTVGCEYVTTLESNNKDVITKAMWTSTHEIICVPGQYMSHTLLDVITHMGQPTCEMSVCKRHVQAWVAQRFLSKLCKSGQAFIYGNLSANFIEVTWGPEPAFWMLIAFYLFKFIWLLCISTVYEYSKTN